MRNAQIVFNASRGEITVHDARTGNQVFAVDAETVSDAQVEGQLVPTDLQSLYDYMSANYWDIMHDFGLM